MRWLLVLLVVPLASAGQLVLEAPSMEVGAAVLEGELAALVATNAPDDWEWLTDGDPAFTDWSLTASHARVQVFTESMEPNLVAAGEVRRSNETFLLHNATMDASRVGSNSYSFAVSMYEQRPAMLRLEAASLSVAPSREASVSERQHLFFQDYPLMEAEVAGALLAWAPAPRMELRGDFVFSLWDIDVVADSVEGRFEFKTGQERHSRVDVPGGLVRGVEDVHDRVAVVMVRDAVLEAVLVAPGPGSVYLRGGSVEAGSMSAADAEGEVVWGEAIRVRQESVELAGQLVVSAVAVEGRVRVDGGGRLDSVVVGGRVQEEPVGAAAVVAGYWQQGAVVVGLALAAVAGLLAWLAMPFSASRDRHGRALELLAGGALWRAAWLLWWARRAYPGHVGLLLAAGDACQARSRHRAALRAYGSAYDGVAVQERAELAARAAYCAAVAGAEDEAGVWMLRLWRLDRARFGEVLQAPPLAGMRQERRFMEHLNAAGVVVG
jgi:hypothetical protein